MVYDEFNIYSLIHKKLKFGKSQNRILIYEMFNQPFLISVEKDYKGHSRITKRSFSTLLDVPLDHILAYYMMSEHLAGG